MGALDFAGGAVVHMSSGAAALAAATGAGASGTATAPSAFIPHNLPMTLTGAAILWFGWFGFNAGSALAADGAAANAFVTTHVAARRRSHRAGLGIEKWHHGKATTLGAGLGRGRRPGGHHPRRRVRDPP